MENRSSNKPRLSDSITWSERSDWVLEPQQERSWKTLRKILDAATTLFVSKGYDNTSVAEIASLAQISAGSVYRRFPDKEAVLHTVLDSYFKTRVWEFDRLIEGTAFESTSPAEIVTFYVDTIFSAYRNDTDIIRLYERRALEDAVVREMAARRSKYVANRTASLLYPALSWAKSDIDKTMTRLHITMRGALIHLILPDAPPTWPDLNIHSDDFKDDMARMALAWFKL